MNKIDIDFGHLNLSLEVPEHTDILSMEKPSILANPEKRIIQALRNPVDCLSLEALAHQKLEANPGAKATIVISDNTRPVPYKGKSGILFPVIDEIIKAGFPPSQIRLLIATGTHRAMGEQELRRMLDSRIFALGLQIINHESRNPRELVSVGTTELGGEIFLSRYYLESDLKILTGLVESHFMAGVSGGRKSICPGILSESSTYILHSGPVLASPRARDLVLDGNPVHEEALRVARMAGCDMIINATIDSNFRLTGVFAGDMEMAHRKAFEKLQSYAAIPVQKKFDLVLGHTGFVGVNHYQAAKGALQFCPLIKDGGICLLAAHHRDPDPVGGPNYKQMMKLLNEIGAERFMKTILDPHWNFIPEQWEAQMWARLFRKIPFSDLIYCCLEIPETAFSWLPGRDARTIIPDTSSLEELVKKSFTWAIEELRQRLGKEPRIAVLPDGPYGIPVEKNG